MDMPILSILILLPLAGAAVIGLLLKESESGYAQARQLALVTSVITLLLSLVLWSHFNPQTPDFQFVERQPWFGGYSIDYHLGIDGISIYMVLLTALLTPVCIVCSWQSITERVREYMVAFLVLESFVIGVFCALDMLLFYLFFEGMLIPMYLIIGIWGGERRIYAAYKFFLYTLLGSVLFLIAMLYLYFTFDTMSIPELMAYAPDLTLGVQKWLWLAMFVSFAVKVPMWPVHTWLPDAHVQAPTAGSVILAGILLKMGAYGFLRFSLPMLPAASHYFAEFVFVLSCIAVVYTSLVALMQEDMKKLIAYSSVAHMGFVTLGIFSFTQQGIEGAIFQMISHGVVSAALFLCVGVVYDRLHTKEIARYGGLVHNMPIYAAVFMVFTMASVGLPATMGFVGEVMVLVGTFQSSQWAALFAATGLVLGAAYMLWLYRRVCFGELTKPDLKDLPDLNKRELLYFVPMVMITVAYGVYPKPILDLLHPSVENLMVQVKAGAAALEAIPVAQPESAPSDEEASTAPESGIGELDFDARQGATTESDAKDAEAKQAQGNQGAPEVDPIPAKPSSLPLNKPLEETVKSLPAELPKGGSE